VLMIKDATSTVERKIHMERLKNLGNHIHNIDCITKGKEEEIIVLRRTSLNGVRNSYVPCRFCCAWLSSVEIGRHRKRCPARDLYPDSDDVQPLQKSRLLLICSLNYIYSEEENICKNKYIYSWPNNCWNILVILLVDEFLG
jgi:hypothetical protein